MKTYVNRSLLFANTAAFLACTKNGAMPSMPNIHEVSAFLKKYIPTNSGDEEM